MRKNKQAVKKIRAMNMGPHIPLLLILALAILGMVVCEVIIYIRISELIDESIDGDVVNLTRSTILIFSLLVINILFLILYNFFRSVFIRNSMARMKTRYMKKVFNKNLNEFKKDNNSLYVSSLTNDYHQIELNYIEPIIDIIFSATNFLAGVFLFTLVNPWILLIAVGLMVVNILISSISSKPLNKHNKERSDLFANYTSYIKEVLSAFHIIKNNNLDEKVRQDYNQKSTQIQQKGYIIDKLRSYVFAIQNTNFTITFVALIAIVGYMSIQGIITFGGVVLIIQSAQKIIWPISSFSQTLPKIMSVKSIFERIENTLKNQIDYKETKDYPGLNTAIQLKDLTFSYEDIDVLESVNIDFKKGGKYLLIGPSGGGKSTVLRLLRKYFNPQSGEILIDGVALKDIKKEQYFSNIANIEQNVFLFEDTIYNNLTLYKKYTDDEVNLAVKRAGLDDFISGLPDGLNTMIYENGKNISGGERSRLAIARGLINKAEIIFLDEAFASLDMEKAKQIEQSILDLKDVTIINVSHVVFKEHKQFYDDIFVINNKTATSL